MGTEGWKIDGIKFVFNIYTGPGYLGGFLGVLNIVLLVLLFRVRKLPTEHKATEKKMKKVLTGVCLCGTPILIYSQCPVHVQTPWGGI